MRILREFSIGDPIPDNAGLVTTSSYLHFKNQQQIIRFFYLVPEEEPKKPSRRKR
jgi:hypothetical protein